MVHLKGLANASEARSAVRSVYMFPLPDGYRPAARSVFTSLRNGALGRINVDADGWVNLDTSVGAACSPDNEWLSLRGDHVPGGVEPP